MRNPTALALLLALGGVDLGAMVREPEGAKRKPRPEEDWTEHIKLVSLPDGRLEFRCHLCPFCRAFGTKPGAVTALVAHYKQKHGTRVMWR